VTLGAQVSGRIEALFSHNDFALGYVLDTVASEAAEVAADRLEDEYEGYLAEIAAWDSSSAHLRYSPGYCGWHISGQRKLFDRLRPEEIGIELNRSFLMQPLKSISGVLVSGPREIHFFNNNYRFCAACTTLSCRERLKPLIET
jgi:cobalamin-dependent methionine synthase I